MKLHKRFLISIIACMMVLSSVTAMAAPEKVDLNRKGSINVTIRDKDKVVSGGSLVIYQVASIFNKEETLSYVFTDEFAGSRLPLENLAGRELSDKLEAWAEKMELEGQILEIDENGYTSIGGLPVGLYLIAQKSTGRSYKPINPFLVSIPITNGDVKIYDIDATPKCQAHQDGEEETPSETPTKPTETPEETPSETPTKPTETPEETPSEAPTKPTETPEETPSENPTETPEVPESPENPTETPEETEETPEEPDTETSEEDSTEPSKVPPTKPPKNPPDKPELPRSGQLWWPVPFMAGAGLYFFMIGCARRIRE